MDRLLSEQLEHPAFFPFERRKGRHRGNRLRRHVSRDPQLFYNVLPPLGELGPRLDQPVRPLAQPALGHPWDREDFPPLLVPFLALILVSQLSLLQAMNLYYGLHSGDASREGSLW